MSAKPGQTFGRVADAYERTRPEYPAEAVEHAVAELALEADATVLDLAAGTGKLTRLLRERFANVIAVEPDEAMRVHIGGDARAGTAEAIPLDDASVDVVFVGDAFHWFDFDRAFAEIARVLRPGGGLVLLWNSWGERDTLPEPFRRDVDAVWSRFHPPGREFADWREAAGRAHFGPMGEHEVVQRVRMAGRDYADLWLTGSTPASIDDDERRAIAERAYAVMDDEYVLAIPTQVYWMRVR